MSCAVPIEQYYLRQIEKRNREEKEFFKSFVDDYSFVLAELKDQKKVVLGLKLENEQIKTLKGDPILFRKTKDELDKIRSQKSTSELDVLSKVLELTQDKQRLSEQNLEFERKVLVLEKRTKEVEEILQEKSQNLDKVTKELKNAKSSLSGVTISITILEEKNKILTEDNAEYVSQLISMKENMAKTINDMLSGNVKKANMDFEMQQRMEEENKQLNSVIKPEYLKNSVMEKVALPSQVDWRQCAHQTETTCLTFNRDGNIIYTGGADGMVKGWDTQNGQEVGVMKGFTKPITDVSASLDNEYVVASSVDQNKITLYRTKTYRYLSHYLGHLDTIAAVKFSFTQKSVISGSKDRTIRHWDMATAKCVRTDSCPQSIYNMDLSDSEFLLATCHSKDIRFWNTKKGEVIHTLNKAHDDIVTCARFTPDERYMVSTSRDHTVKVWDIRTWKPLYEPFEDESYSCPTSNQTKLCISPDSRYAVVGSSNGSVIVLDIKSHKSAQIEEVYEDEHMGQVIGCEWQPRGALFATIDKTGGLLIWKE